MIDINSQVNKAKKLESEAGKISRAMREAGSIYEGSAYMLEKIAMHMRNAEQAIEIIQGRNHSQEEINEVRINLSRTLSLILDGIM